jgi:thiol-disulfide isomerase/thioredoxin
LAIGAAAPDFSLAGVDGKTHTLQEYAGNAVLAVVFTCNHCPAAQLYEQRLKELHEAYRDRSVALVAINADSPDALTPADLAYSDVGDSLRDMKTRASLRHLEYPYLFDGERQTTARAFGVVATPQIFVFDRERTLRYEGRIDDNLQTSRVTRHDARDAIDALVAGRPVAVAETKPEGCAPAWRSGSGTRPPADTAAKVGVEMATADTLTALRANGSDKLLFVNFWATWCGPCAAEFPDLVATAEMYRGRQVEFVSVSENQPEERDLVVAFLERNRATGRNLLFSTPDTYGLQEAFDPAMPAAVPFTLVIAPNGDVVYQELGSLDILKLRRAILANLPDDSKHPGAQAYWTGD